MKQTDIDFLKDLQHELLTQDPECNAEPVVWNIMEDFVQPVPEDFGEYQVANIDCKEYDADELRDLIVDCYIDEDDEELMAAWDKVDKEDVEAMADFLGEQKILDADVYWVQVQQRIATSPCAFLTKRAAQHYVDTYGYNHNKAHTYSSCAYRNTELERLLNILKAIDFNDIKVTK